MKTAGDNPQRQRQAAPPFGGVGSHRYALYEQAWARVESASAAGYHLEAITLLESLLSDRIESRTSYLVPDSPTFQPLGRLIQIWRPAEVVSEFKVLIEDINAWRELRNRSLHEMVKFEQGERPTWEEKTSPLAEIVTRGKDLLRAFAVLDERERAEHGVRPPATYPSAFGQQPLHARQDETR